MWQILLPSTTRSPGLYKFFFLILRRPPRSTLFPTRRSSDLGRVLHHLWRSAPNSNPIAHFGVRSPAIRNWGGDPFWGERSGLGNSFDCIDSHDRDRIWLRAFRDQHPTDERCSVGCVLWSGFGNGSDIGSRLRRKGTSRARTRAACPRASGYGSAASTGNHCGIV